MERPRTLWAGKEKRGGWGVSMHHAPSALKQANGAIQGLASKGWEGMIAYTKGSVIISDIFCKVVLVRDRGRIREENS